MTDSEIDNAIVAVAGEAWRKVAMILATAGDRLGLEPTDETGDLIAGRIGSLVCSGRLEAGGNLKLWRASEIRRKL